MNQIVISLDAMGGDLGISAVVPAALSALARHKNLKLVLVGDETQIADHLAVCKKEKLPEIEDLDARLSIHHASQVVGMDEAPSSALRGKKDSSMRVAINLIKEQKVAACVSAGNTGALMATARFVLKTLPGIDRPAIISALPTANGHVHMLDLGANVDSSADHLYQFAVMGSVLCAQVDNVDAPTIGLLNVGEEEIKGNLQVKDAAKRLAESPLNYHGFVEGDDIFKGSVDVVVADGFVGNVALKSGEGLAKMVTQILKEEFGRNLLTKISAAFAMPVLNRIRSRLDPRRYNGASLVGLRGIVVKSHGSADSFAFTHAIDEAVKEVSKDVPTKIEQTLAELLTDKS